MDMIRLLLEKGADKTIKKNVRSAKKNILNSVAYHLLICFGGCFPRCRAAALLLLLRRTMQLGNCLTHSRLPARLARQQRSLQQRLRLLWRQSHQLVSADEVIFSQHCTDFTKLILFGLVEFVGKEVSAGK